MGADPAGGAKDRKNRTKHKKAGADDPCLCYLCASAPADAAPQAMVLGSAISPMAPRQALVKWPLETP